MTDEKRTSPGPDYDTPWKQVIERYFKEFTAFFFPEVHAAIDWSREHEFLDKELSQVDPESEIGRRLVDKLVKVWQKNGELEESRNPFAVVVLAHLKTLETASEPHQRFKWKFNLVRMLYERGYSREDVTALYRFIDWVMFLPDDLEADFRRTVYAYEEEKKMPYISSIERVGIEKGIQQGIQQGVQQGVQQGMLQRSREAVIEILETRFETVPHSVISAVEKTDDTSVLKTLFHEAITVKSINEFIKILNTITV